MRKRPGMGTAAQAFEKRTGVKAPRIIAWEITRSCNLMCAHCRAAAHCEPYPGELTLDECKRLIDDIASITDPILILTGGEPLMRADIWNIIDYAHEKGLHPVIGTNGTLIDDECAARIAEHGIPRVSVSLDFPTAEGQDAFRGKAGAFDEAVAGVRALRSHGVGVQVNTTITKMNSHLVDDMHNLALAEGAEAFHPFLLVPTGRGEDLADVELTPDEYEEVLTWAYRCQKTSPLHFKPTDAPQYYRIIRQMCAAEGREVNRETYGMEAMTRGCLGGITFAFISHVGDVQPCGYFDMQLGNVKERPFSQIWETSPVFDDLRHFDRLRGKCGNCEYKGVCGGCRARALATTGDYLAEEPYCAYTPRKLREAEGEDARASMRTAEQQDVHLDRRTAHIAEPAENARQRVLDEIQSGFPLESDPYGVLAERLGLSREQVLDSVGAMREDGTIRQIAASLSSRKLGYVSTLCALAVKGDQERIDQVGEMINAHPEVTHNYQRDAAYNIWFTAIASSQTDLERLAGEVASESGCEVLDLPVTSLYKIRVDFGKHEAKVAGTPEAEGAKGKRRTTPEAESATGKRRTTPEAESATGKHNVKPASKPFDANDPFDVALVRWMQADVPGEHPFRDGATLIAAETGDASVDEQRVLRRLRELKANGTVRRFGAFVRHQKLGYAFNGMTIWNVPREQADELGKSLAALPFVSHCYGRRPHPSWPYNLYAMAHAKTQEELDGYVDEMKRLSGLEPLVLISTKEYKKVLPTYFAR